MAQIIKNESLDNSEILSNINSYIQTLPNAQDIKETLDNSAIQTINQLNAGTATWMLYYLNRNRLETYLSTATQDTSIYQISKMFGYNVSRAKAPSVQMKYNDIPTIVLTTGTILGKWNNLEIVYIGKSKVLEKGDTVTAYIGKYRTLESQINSTASNKLIVSLLQAQTLETVDNDNIRFTIKDTEYEISKDVEDYVVFGSLIDFTDSQNSTKIYIRDFEFNYGIKNIPDGTQYKIEFLETNGMENELKLKDIQASEGYICSDILSNGSDTESVRKIKENTPFYYSTLRRAVTQKDHTYLAKAHSLIEDANCVTEKGTVGEYEIGLTKSSITVGDKYTVGINSSTTYSVVALENETSSELLTRLIEQLNKGGWVDASLKNNTTIYIKNREARVDLSIVGSSHFKTVTEIVKQVKPPCCTATIYYIRSGQPRDEAEVSLTESEQLEYGLYIKQFKMTGLTIILVPATKIEYNVGLKVELHDPSIEIDGVSIIDIVRQQARDIVDNGYEFRIGKLFSYYEMIASIAQIEVTLDDGSKVKPIKSIEQNQATEYPVKDIQCDYNEYIAIPQIDIKFENVSVINE